MATQRDICVLALRLLGQSANITGLAENSVYADTASAVYPVVRDALLERHAWNFATTTVRLQKVLEKPTGWGTAYALPSDCLRALHVSTDPTPEKDEKRKPPHYEPNREVREGLDFVSPEVAAMIEHWDYAPWTVEMLGPRRVVLTDMPSPVLKYIRKVSNPDFYSAGFTHALAWHVAAALAGPIVKGDTGVTVGAKLLQSAQAYERSAVAMDANARRVPAYRPDAPWYR